MPDEKFSLLRRILGAIGLKPAAVDDVVDRIYELLHQSESKPAANSFPYHLRDHFLSPAEHSFYLVLKQAVADWALVCPKVSLGDVFYVRSSDASLFRTYTNRIDRKHVDFLLCDPKTLKPMAGIELDDKSHRREDRQERDQFVEHVFAAAQLPLVRLSAKHGYSVQALTQILRQQAGVTLPAQAAQSLPEPEPPRCPECSSPMVLRSAKSGPSQGKQFWGCVNFPRCREIRPYERQAT